MSGHFVQFPAAQKPIRMLTRKVGCLFPRAHSNGGPHALLFSRCSGHGHDDGRDRLRFRSAVANAATVAGAIATGAAGPMGLALRS